MRDEQVARAIEGLEQALRRDDPAFLRRFRHVHRSEAANAFSSFALLATGTVLLTLGLATAAWTTWCLGLAALAASVLVDVHRRHCLDRQPPTP